MLQSILYGNGINRLTPGMPSWDQLIKEISDFELNQNIPNTLKYEALLMKKPYRGPNRMLKTSDGHGVITSDGHTLSQKGELTEKALKEKIAERLKTFGTNSIYDSISKLPVSHFITTNYDNALFTSLGKGALNHRFREEKIYSIRRNYIISTSSGVQKYYWPIHGSIDSPASIMLGFDHYCGSLAKIEQYVKGGYDLHNRNLESMSKRLQDGITEVISWVDLFFISDIHILGLNLGYEETDLWWILNKRRRIKHADANLVKNRIIYYPVEVLPDDILQLLSSFEVDVVSLDEKTLKRRFIDRYYAQVAAIKNQMTK